MLRFIKLVHTIVWVIMAGASFYAIYSAFVGRFDGRFWLAAGLIAGEVTVLVAGGWKCPLTSVAERYTEERGDAFDIYLPGWLARHNVKIFSTLLALGAAACMVRWILGV